MRIVVGADPYGRELKDAVRVDLERGGHECVDLGGRAGEERSYYEVAHDLAQRIASGEFERGILVCGTGMGMAIVANKHPGVYAAVCADAEAAANARSINDANVLTLGGMVTSPDRAREIVETFLTTGFKSGWDADVRAFLDRSKTDIRRIEAVEFGGES